MNVRLLKANEIDVRVGTINEKGATLLLYKDARVDMNILDESGVKWKRSHELINGNLFCTISVFDEEIGEWISRQDVGVESNTEKEKGQASDAFKRAGFNFGIGRELYTAPFTWISADTYNGFINGKTPNGKDRWATYDKFAVDKISYDDNKEISELVIRNTKSNKIVFNFGGSQSTNNKSSKKEFPQLEVEHSNKSKWQPSADRPVSDDQRFMINNLLRKEGVEGTDNITTWMYDNFGALPENELQAYEVINSLNAKLPEEKR